MTQQEAPQFWTGCPDLFGRRPVYGFGTPELSVHLGVKDGAKGIDAFVREHHYSHSVVWSSNLHFWVFWFTERIGAIQLGPAMNPASGGKIVRGAEPSEWLELNRMVFGEHKPTQAASRAIRYALTLARHCHPKLQWIQSFADERCGKLGAVYQACSFVYCGSHLSTFYELDGEWFHKSAWGRAAVDKRGWGCGPRIEWFNANRDRATAHTFRQFRYIKFLKPSARRRLLLSEQPYPKPNALAEATA